MSGHFQVRKNKLHNRVFLKPSCLHPVFGPSFTHYPLFERGPQSKEILLNLDIKSWNSAFNAQVIIVVVQVGAVEIYVATVEALRRKEREGQNRMKLSLRQKEMVHFWLSPPFPQPATPGRLMYSFAGFFFECHPILDETQGSSAVFSWL
jgi:hypothetical protein